MNRSISNYINHHTTASKINRSLLYYLSIFVTLVHHVNNLKPWRAQLVNLSAVEPPVTRVELAQLRRLKDPEGSPPRGACSSRLVTMGGAELVLHSASVYSL